MIPRLIVGLSTISVAEPARRARAARARRRGACVELFVAFDDPESAVALLGLAERLAGRRAELVVEPVVERGIPGDPAVEAKRRYAIADARRLARRQRLELSRAEPLAPSETAFLAAWASATRGEAAPRVLRPPR